jgi:hypothetical protein
MPTSYTVISERSMILNQIISTTIQAPVLTLTNTTAHYLRVTSVFITLANHSQIQLSKTSTNFTIPAKQAPVKPSRDG